MVTLPAEIPVTEPPEVILAVPVPATTLHVPLPVASDNVIALEIQVERVPLIAAGCVLIVTPTLDDNCDSPLIVQLTKHL